MEGSVDWIHLAQDRNQWGALVNMVKNFRVPYDAEKFLRSSATGSFSTARLHEVTGKQREPKLTTFGGFIAVIVQTVIFWIMTPCSLVSE
jgi:hypothetical protein